MSFRRDAPFPVAEYADTGTAQLAVNAVRALGDGDHVLLARHGVVGVGATLDDALAVCLRVERLSVVP
jgi:L-fuculose-phosphate aldolase